MIPAPHSHAGGRSLPLSRWIIALITAGLSVDEAIQHYKAIVTFQRKLAADPVLRFSARRDLGLHRMAAERVLVARYFRRFGQRVWKCDTRRAA